VSKPVLAAMTENMKMKFNPSAQSRLQTGAENGLQLFSALLWLRLRRAMPLR
jgi:hypothetical protein